MSFQTRNFPCGSGTLGNIQLKIQLCRAQTLYLMDIPYSGKSIFETWIPEWCHVYICQLLDSSIWMGICIEPSHRIAGLLIGSEYRYLECFFQRYCSHPCCSGANYYIRGVLAKSKRSLAKKKKRGKRRVNPNQDILWVKAETFQAHAESSTKQTLDLTCVNSEERAYLLLLSCQATWFFFNCKLN